MIYKLNANNNYERAEIYSKDDEVRVGVLSDLTIKMDDVFKQD